MKIENNIKITQVITQFTIKLNSFFFFARASSISFGQNSVTFISDLDPASTIQKAQKKKKKNPKILRFPQGFLLT
jgi:hypothetical protein